MKSLFTGHSTRFFGGTLVNRFYRFINITLVIFFITLLIPNSTFSHSSLEKTNPVGGERLELSPSTIEVWFEDPVVIHSNSIKLIGNETNVSIGETIYGSGNKSHITAAIPNELPKGKYTVEINVLALDGAVVNQKFVFEVINTINSDNKNELKLVKQIPTDGEIIKGQPKQIELWFNKPVKLTAIGLFDDKQGNVILQEPKVDPLNPNHLTVSIDEPIKDGTYQVTWYARPAVNVEPNTPDSIDVFYFAVNKFTPIEEVKNGPLIQRSWFPNIGLKQIGYWFWFIGVMILFGGSVIAFNSRKDKLLFRRWQKYSTLFLLFCLVGISFVLYEQKQELNNISLNKFILMKFVWIPIIQLLAFTIGFLYRKGQPWFYGIGLSLLPFIIGHSSYPRYGGWLTFLANEIHLFAASLWLGGVLGLIIIPPKVQLFEYIKQNGAGFARIAFWSIVALAITGIYMAIQYIPSFSFTSIIGSQWGKALLIKTLLTYFVLILGFMQRKYIKNIVSSLVGKFRKRLKVEFIYSLFILLFASILVVSTPSTAEQGVYLERSSDTLKAPDVDISPLKSGVNEFTIKFEQEIESVNVTLSMPPSYIVNYDAFKVNKNTFKLTGNLLHAAGTVNMQIRSKTPTGDLLDYDYRIVVPGEYRVNE